MGFWVDVLKEVDRDLVLGRWWSLGLGGEGGVNSRDG